MATGSDDSKFAEFNSSKVPKEFKERQEKLKRKEISSHQFGRMMVFDILGDLRVYLKRESETRNAYNQR